MILFGMSRSFRLVFTQRAKYIPIYQQDKMLSWLNLQKTREFVVQLSQDFLSHIYIILENSEFCNKVLTILKNIAILLVRSGRLPSTSKIHKEKRKGSYYEEV